MAAEAPTLALTIQYGVDKSGLPERWQLRLWAKAVLLQSAEVTLRLVDAEEGRQLNRDYRGKDYPTNVLTFTYGSDPAGMLSGDIALCAPVIAREAVEQGKPLLDHYAHMVVHGMLHLQGYDHEQGESETIAMEAVEGFIMQRLGFPDPYLTYERRQ
jgi:probable rRNA maturation factor